MEKILVIDDNEDNLEVLVRKLQSRGYETIGAIDAKEGILKAQNQIPDLILMDIDLPKIDGYEATRRLKAKEKTKAIPIIAVTAHAMIGDKEKCMEAGCDDFDSKPIAFQGLLEKIEKHLYKKHNGKKQLEIPTNHILIADDNEMNRDGLARLLEKKGYRTSVVINGKETLSSVIKKNFDLLLLDIMMPDIAGTDVLKNIREIYSASDLPIIMVTAKSEGTDIATSLGLGANDYVTKPIDIDILLSRIQVQLELKNANAKLLKQIEISESLRSIHNNMGDAIIVADKNENFLIFNPAARDIFGVGSMNISSYEWAKTYNIFLPDMKTLCPRKDLPLVKAIEGKKSENVELFVRHSKAPEGIWITVTGNPLEDKDGELRGGVIICRDITYRKRIEKKLLNKAYYDELTSLPNRNLLLDRLNQLIKRKKRNKGFMFALLFIDLDNFKPINDSLGHLSGDKILVQVAGILNKTLRSSDTVSRIGQNATIGRLGGDEFIILLEDIKERQNALQVCERIQEAIGIPLKIKNRDIHISASIGIVICSDKYNDAEGLLRDADIAMYKAKSNGMGNQVIFDDKMHTLVLKRFELENELRMATNNFDFLLHFQPITIKGRIVSFESLIRWQKADGKIVSPLDFIPIAEETGLIVAIGDWVIREACLQCKIWHNSGHKQLTVTVNVSIRQFNEKDFIKNLKRILDETGLDPEFLGLELTESTIMKNEKKTLSILNSLKKLGVFLLLDDFGTGYSSLAYLYRYPIDILKIDRIFVDDIKTNPEHAIITDAIIDMGHRLNKKIIAEGVETGEQANCLEKMLCDKLQGFYFSKPLESSKVKELLDKREILPL